MPLFVQSKKIVTVSNFSKKDICGTYKVDQSKVSVIYNGGNPFINLSKKKNSLSSTKSRATLSNICGFYIKKNIRLKHLMFLIMMENLILLL